MTLDEQIELLQEAVSASPLSQFVKSCFSDYIDDMGDTDWNWYGQEPDMWKEILTSFSVEELLNTLKQFGGDVEEDAYQNGYIPDEVDIREWSTHLVDYLT